MKLAAIIALVAIVVLFAAGISYFTGLPIDKIILGFLVWATAGNAVDHAMKEQKAK